MSDFMQSGAFNVNDQWATAIRYEAKMEDGRLAAIGVHFMNGPNQIATAKLDRAGALEVLGEKNVAAIEGGTAKTEYPRETLQRGQLHGRLLQFRRAYLAEYAEQHNTIERDSRAQEPEPPARKEAAPTALAPDAQSSSAASPAPAPPDAEAERDAGSERQTNDLPPLEPDALPQSVTARFIRIDDKFYFPDRTLAFVDQGTRLRAETENREVLHTLIDIAKARGWEGIKVTGSESFRSAAWREATLQGLGVRGYTPSEVERAQIDKELGVDRNGAHAARPEAQPNTVQRDARMRAPADADQVQDKAQGREKDAAEQGARERILFGKLIQAGSATYRFEPQGAPSYFIKIATDQGERVLWGSDLERALNQSQSKPQPGEAIGIRVLGQTAVTVKTPVRDQHGRLTGHQQIGAHRNAWQVEKREFFEERAQQAAALRNERGDEKRLAQRHPELASAIAAIRMAELFAQKHLGIEADRERFVHLVRESLARSVERGDRMPELRLREAPARTDIADRERIQEPALVR